ncbi:MAG TPA: OmpA family protein [Fulvivirga sp.]|nr:OmpA family protein [Fulvivirga sp.]
MSITLILFFAGVFTGYSQTPSNSEKEGKSYVVIGAFAFEKNAIKLANYAKTLNIKADYQLHPTKDIFYVYEIAENATAERDRILANFPQFYDVWVYRGILGRNQDINKPNVKISEGNKLPDVNKSNQVKKSKKTAENTLVNEDAESRLEKKENVYYLYLNTVNAKNLKEVKGKVNIIDPVRAKQLQVAKSLELVEVKDPNNGSSQIKLATDMFGFREVQQNVNLKDPINDSTKSVIHMIGDSIIVDFAMQRFKKGDVLVMYNVYFFIDAAIMKPESIYELNSLLDMLKENNKLFVRIHGHTNGNSSGKIIHLDPEDKNFFSLNAEHKEGRGSAKKLSLYRAYTIQRWLIEQGISEDRMEIKGWGGKKMIYDKNDPQAFKNVRVEIEILEDN